MRELFEDLREQLGCEYISDLRFAPYLQRARALMRETELDRYPLSALSDAAEYLYGEKPVFENHEAAKAFFRER